MTSREMFKAPSLKPGYWFVNVAKVDQPQNWEVTLMEPDVTTYDGKIFGYPEAEFLKRQYK